jgi:hypothetical protein
MSELITKSYRNLLQAIADQPRYFQGKDLVAFHPMRGVGETVDTMFIGRALNGWHWNFDVKSLQNSQEEILHSVLNKQHPSSDQNNPLSWVDNHHSSGKKYNSARSQFWKVLRGVSQARNPKSHWSEEIVWSNFFKVAPWGRNPSSKMINVMGLASHELLLAEIQHFKPRNIVCLTGTNWAEYLRDSASLKQEIAFKGDLVEYVADLSWNNENSVIRFVISPHPQTRPAKQLINEILQALKK